MLNLLELANFLLIDKSDSNTVAVGSGCSANAVYIVLGVVGHIVINDNADVVNINASTDNVSSYQHVYLTGLETIHHVIAFSLSKVTVHLGAVDVHALQLAGDVFHTVFLT